MIDNLYKDENRSLDIRYISLTKIYENKLIDNDEIKNTTRKIKVHSKKYKKDLDIWNYLQRF